jgi:hypothetical protein
VRDLLLSGEPGEVKKSGEVRPILVISVAETIVLNAVGWFIWGCYDWPLHTSPRQQEWFGRAPWAARFWLLDLTAAVSLALPQTCFPLMAYFALPRGVRRRFPLRLGLGGSPPLLGAVVFVAFGVMVIGSFIFLASFED